MPFKIYWQSVQLSTALLVSLAAFLSSSGCDAEGRTPSSTPSPVPDSPRANVEGLAAILGVDAAEIEAKLDPPAPSGDLAADIAAFTTLEACVASRVQTDPLLGDALDAIGYDTFLMDACRVLDAAKAHDVRRCDGIDASALHDRCTATVAEIVGAPDMCPSEIADHPRSGRDPACVAIALRDERLCVAARAGRVRATCQATIRHDAAACRSLGGRTDQASCARTAARWATVITAPQAPAPPLIGAGSFFFSPTATGGTQSTPETADLTPDLAQGVVISQRHDGTRFVIGNPSGEGTDLIATSPHARPAFALEMLVSMGGGKPVIERAELRLPGRATVSTPIAVSSLRATVQKFEPMRGGAVQLTVDGDLGDAVSSFHVHAEVSTFVRDVVGGAELFGGSSSRTPSIPATRPQ